MHTNRCCMVCFAVLFATAAGARHLLCLSNSEITFKLGKGAFRHSQMVGQGQSGGAAEKTECFSKDFKTTRKLQG